MNALLSVSMLSADFGRLAQDVQAVNQSPADWFHLDIMDGVFVPNISYGFPVVASIAKQARKPLDAHLMIVDPDRYIERFRDAGVAYLSLHYEACTHLHRSLQHIRKLGMKAGIALNPHTPVACLEDILEEADFVLLMSVNPGFGGQKFIPHTLHKVSRLKELILKKNPSCLIEVDGGIDADNATSVIQAGADILVAGHALFKDGNLEASIQAFTHNTLLP
ncbi:MAG: ribulose-phosphate 3-epimerase [Bacteroidales bacterium]|nr:ribulose-phosphate 3-epimerase [Bacteroidales bacterium]MCL2739054.1 ribulose-phosphate 3-epimerase [Bacteroidales bacterium]